MRLFYRPRTGRPFRVAWALEEIGAPYEAVAVAAEEAASPTHLARRPLGRVPVLEFDSGAAGDPVTLFDSTALILQIVDLYPEAELIGPLGSRERGEAYQWCLTAMTELEKPAVNALRGYDIPTQRDAFAAAAAAFASALDGSEFLVAGRFGVADMVLGGVLVVGEHAGLVGERAGVVGGPGGVSPPRIERYLAALRARPAFGRALERTEALFRPA